MGDGLAMCPGASRRPEQCAVFAEPAVDDDQREARILVLDSRLTVDVDERSLARRVDRDVDGAPGEQQLRNCQVVEARERILPRVERGPAADTCDAQPEKVVRSPSASTRRCRRRGLARPCGKPNTWRITGKAEPGGGDVAHKAPGEGSTRGPDRPGLPSQVVHVQRFVYLLVVHL